MADALSVAVRPLAAEEMEAVARHLPGAETGKHWDRLAQQQSGSGRYLIAWRWAEPVGHVFLRFGGTADTRVLNLVGPCPYLQDLYVLSRWRSRGVGTRLLTAAEEEARAAGHTRIGLSVAANNTLARVLYARLGYRDCGLGEYPTFGDAPAEWFDTSYYLVKELG